MRSDNEASGGDLVPCQETLVLLWNLCSLIQRLKSTRDVDVIRSQSECSGLASLALDFVHGY
ncbi:unnamed protein product [Tuber melanosporum]|uniref:(Perigord truffle) hypothetical protein n=1 Tax=Tuber melanosporum (strain Mel28) TaxID=656061 RepID=D5GE41_TUBMM|nr:uncharacterized protein GSTUM_00006366001 [Tuber melanosporum]CAZ82784.1 unnamed protein product [Tuber melanosporum]